MNTLVVCPFFHRSILLFLVASVLNCTKSSSHPMVFLHIATAMRHPHSWTNHFNHFMNADSINPQSWLMAMLFLVNKPSTWPQTWPLGGDSIPIPSLRLLTSARRNRLRTPPWGIAARELIATFKIARTELAQLTVLLFCLTIEIGIDNRDSKTSQLK